MVIGPINFLVVVVDDDAVDKAPSVALDVVDDVEVATSSKPTGVRPVVCSIILVIKLGAYAKRQSVDRRCLAELIGRRRWLGGWKARTTMIPIVTSWNSNESAKRLCRRRRGTTIME